MAPQNHVGPSRRDCGLSAQVMKTDHRVLVSHAERHVDSCNIQLLVFCDLLDRNGLSQVTILWGAGRRPSPSHITSQRSLWAKEEPDSIPRAFPNHVPCRKDNGLALPNHGRPCSNAGAFLAVPSPDNSYRMRGDRLFKRFECCVVHFGHTVLIIAPVGEPRVHSDFCHHDGEPLGRGRGNEHRHSPEAPGTPGNGVRGDRTVGNCRELQLRQGRVPQDDFGLTTPPVEEFQPNVRVA